MRRNAIKYLEDWKNADKRKPLLIKGARQVGKTWLMKKFGDGHYEKVAYVNFESSNNLHSTFAGGYDVRQIIMALQIETGISIQHDNTLIILDEIQEVPGALTSLKYFQENAPEYHIVSAGSLLGVALKNETSFPVGKVDFMELYPLDFTEYLDAMGEQPLLELLEYQDWPLIRTFKSRFIQLLRQYYFTGGMPEVVADFADNRDFFRARNIQNQILQAYEQDFSKHAPNDIVPRIRMLWNSIPTQLGKENKKFIYSIIRKGGRAKDYELALSWMIDCGLVYKITRINKPGMPLKAYEDFNAFKLFMVDVGLLCAMTALDPKILLDNHRIMTEFKGALTEQYVLQQLISDQDLRVHYWTAKNATSELDFIIQHKNLIIPIEVKAEENLSAKSLKVFHQKYQSRISIRTSLSDFRKEEWLTNLPLYTIRLISKII